MKMGYTHQMAFSLHQRRATPQLLVKGTHTHHGKMGSLMINHQIQGHKFQTNSENVTQFSLEKVQP
jgi:hypothetical protein